MPTTYTIPYGEFVAAPTPAFPNGRVAKRPFLIVSLLSGAKRLSCHAIVDSGADHCVFPRSFMGPLGIDSLTAPVERTSGVGGSNVPTHFADITLDLQGVLTIPVYAGFTEGLDHSGIGLLGQAGFFERFKIIFDHARGIYQLEVA